MVLGHEGVGVVEAVGPEVKNLKKGDRVGWGYETDACGQCTQCFASDEIYCPSRAIYGGDMSKDQGSFATGAVWREPFLHPIPDGMTDEAAAPLQCGGATVYTALLNVKPTDTVGIMGVGGLGHLAIQFAAKMGCRVVVLSGSDRKRDEAVRLGAHEFVAMSGLKPEDAEKVSKMDRLVVTMSGQPEWASVVPMLNPRAQIFPLGVSFDDFSIPYMALITKGIIIKGSLVASRGVHRDMLAFAAFHKIEPVLEKFPMTEQGIQDAMDNLEKGNLHYRAVLIPA